MLRAHKIKLVTTADQEIYFSRCCGVARFVFNWALAEWNRQHEAGQKPNAFALEKQFTAWEMSESTFVKIMGGLQEASDVASGGAAAHRLHYNGHPYVPEARLATLEAAVREVIRLVNVYLPPDTKMTKDDLINGVISAVDNAKVFEALEKVK
jgi:hypothetical protein